MSKKRFFTLVEILVATGIIAILAGMGFAGYRYATRAGRESSTKSLMAQLTTAIETCHNKLGFYPSASSYGTITVTFTNGIADKIVFNGLEYSKTSTGSKKKFFDLFTKTMDMENLKSYCGTDGVINDSWGNPVYYKFPGSVNTNKYDLISAGEDGKFGKDAAETPSGTKTDYIENAEWLCDDIANF